MLSAVWSQMRNVQISERPIPNPHAHEALIRVLFCGLCGSDFDEYHEGPIVATPPVILGHEICGVVSKAAEDGSGPEVGKRVVVDVVLGCGVCFWCSQGEEGLCANLRVLGQQLNGGLANFMVARADRLIEVPDSVTDMEAAMAEPVSVAVRALSKVSEIQGRQVLVVGGGTIGIIVAQLAKAWGAAVVRVLEPSVFRRELLSQWDIQGIWSDSKLERSALINASFADPGPSLVIECSGKAGMTAEAVSLAAKGGLVLVLGVLQEPEHVDMLDLLLGEKTIQGSAAHRWDTDVRTAVKLIAERTLDLTPLISKVYPLTEVKAALDNASNSPDEIIKVLIDCTPTGRASIEEE